MTKNLILDLILAQKFDNIKKKKKNDPALRKLIDRRVDGQTD